jgi:hypothetical protein
MDPTDVIQEIERGFAETPNPGAAFLVGRREGCEPAEVVAPFEAIERWQDAPVKMLDSHSEALSFLSEGGFRFFLPAFLVADVRGQLDRADPVFHLVGPFSELNVSVPIDGQVFDRPVGGSTFLNPRRYGAMTHEDYGRYRLSVFTREEAAAIVTYLEFRRHGAESFERDQIRAGLERYWLARASHAPTGAAARAFVAAEEQYLQAVEQRHPDSTS